MNLAALVCEQRHFLADNLEDQNLFILIQLAVGASVEHGDDFCRTGKPEKVVDVSSTLFKQQSDVCFIEYAFFSEIGLANFTPHFLALTGTTNQRFGFTNKFCSLVFWDIGQAAVSLGNVVDVSAARLVVGRLLHDSFILFNFILMCHLVSAVLTTAITGFKTLVLLVSTI